MNENVKKGNKSANYYYFIFKLIQTFISLNFTILTKSDFIQLAVFGVTKKYG